MQTSSSSVDTRVTGPGASGQLTLGYEVLDDIYAGASVFLDSALSPERRTGELVSSDVGLMFFGAGLSGLVTHRSGWVVGGGLYFARQRSRTSVGTTLDTLVGSDTGAPIEDSGYGGAIALEGGRDWPIGESLWLGFLVRAFYGQFDTSVARWSPVAATLNVSLSYR